MAACSDDKVLFAIHTVCHRCSVTACRKLRLPQFFSGLDIEGANIRVESTSDEHRSEEHTSELQSRLHLVCRLLLEKKKTTVPLFRRDLHSSTGRSRRPVSQYRPNHG